MGLAIDGSKIQRDLKLIRKALMRYNFDKNERTWAWEVPQGDRVSS
jgi:hypothetical protein